MATVVDVTNSVYPDVYKGNNITPMQGISLVPSFNGEVYNYKKVRFWEHEGSAAARKGDWKIVKRYYWNNPDSLRWELYNIREDRTEENNLVDEKPGVFKELYNWYQKLGE